MGARNQIGRGLSYQSPNFKTYNGAQELIPPAYVACAGIFKQPMGARNWVGIGLWYWPASYTASRSWFLVIKVADQVSGSGSGSGSRRPKWPTKIEKKFKSSCFEVLDAWPLWRAEGFFCNLVVLYGGLGIGKLSFWSKKKINFFFSCNFFQFLVIKALDLDRFSA